MGVPTKALQNFLLFSFLLWFEWFKTWWVRQLRLYKTSFYSKCKDAAIKDFKIRILICFNSPITEHWTFLHQTPHVYPILLWNWELLATFETLGGGLQIIFELQKQRHNVWRFELLSVLKCSLTNPSTLDYLRCLFFSFLWDALLMCNQFSGRIGRHGSIVLASQEWVITGNLALLAHVDGVPQDWLWAISPFFCFTDMLFLPHPSCPFIHQAFTCLHVLNSWVPGHATHTRLASNFLGLQDLTC
jgi:hypothetical protein